MTSPWDPKPEPRRFLLVNADREPGTEYVVQAEGLYTSNGDTMFCWLNAEVRDEYPTFTRRTNPDDLIPYWPDLNVAVVWLDPSVEERREAQEARNLAEIKKRTAPWEAQRLKDEIKAEILAEVRELITALVDRDTEPGLHELIDADHFEATGRLVPDSSTEVTELLARFGLDKPPAVADQVEEDSENDVVDEYVPRRAFFEPGSLVYSEPVFEADELVAVSLVAEPNPAGPVGVVMPDGQIASAGVVTWEDVSPPDADSDPLVKANLNRPISVDFPLADVSSEALNLLLGPACCKNCGQSIHLIRRLGQDVWVHSGLSPTEFCVWRAEPNFSSREMVR